MVPPLWAWGGGPEASWNKKNSSLVVHPDYVILFWVPFIRIFKKKVMCVIAPR